MNVVDLFGLRFHNLDLIEAVDYCEDLLRVGKKGLVIPTNVDVIVKLTGDRTFRETYERAILVVADGAPVVWASRLLGKPLKSRVCGSDLLPAICERAAQREWRVFFLGGMPGVASHAATLLTNRFPGLNVIGTYAPPFGFESSLAECQRIVTMVRTARPDILFVGLGAPKQEKWSAAHFEALGVPIIFCTGAAFDFVAGVIRRAPPWMQRIGLEWMFRLLQEPKRLWRRYLVDSLTFMPIFFLEWSHKPKG
jgi:N-acetylglucosaminyldiphosphoundecaprenol N-acetyl-beta-D-mannosaminyltransferase